jgi:hypothetical protein
MTARDPLEVARLCFAAVEAEDWATAASCLDPVGLAKWHLAWCRRAERPAAAVSDVETWKQTFDPELPHDVAVYFVNRQKAAGDADHIAERFARLRQGSQLRELSPADAVARYLEAQDPRKWLRDQAQASGETSRPILKRRVVGSLPADESSAYVVYERSLGPMPDRAESTLPFIATLVHRRDDWYFDVSPLCELIRAAGTWYAVEARYVSL